jgi:hypothetical protein
LVPNRVIHFYGPYLKVADLCGIDKEPYLVEDFFRNQQPALASNIPMVMV